MALSTERFAAELTRDIRARRSFGGHPLWRRIAEGGVSREALGTFAAQFYLQVYEFPRAVSALHSRCSDAEERVRLAESLYEEETGRISGVNKPHPEVFLDFSAVIGLDRAQAVRTPALPSPAPLVP